MLIPLPLERYAGPVPAFPLPEATTKEGSEGDIDTLSAIERAKWRKIWTYPQAHVWGLPEWEWVHDTLGMYCRLWARCQSIDESASLQTQLNRLAEMVGLSARGLAEMGYRIAASDEMITINNGGKKAARRKETGSRGRVKMK